MGNDETQSLTRRDLLTGMGALAAGAILGRAAGRSAMAAAKPDARRPSIILIEADDLGYGDLGCYGGTAIRSPELDRLAKQGVRLTDFYVAAPLCAPTRVSAMTGKYHQRTSLAWNPNYKNLEDGLSPDEITIAEILRDHGYHTGLVGKWHLGYGEKFRPRKQGFQEYYGFLSGWADYYKHTYNEDTNWMFRNDDKFDEPGYMTDLLTREAIAYLDRHQAEPFFLYLAYNAPHWPHQAPEAWLEHSQSGAYGAMVECLDDRIGELLAHLDRLGLRKDTLVVFFSDNGSDGSGSNAPFSGGKGNLGEGGIRVPCIARWPGHIPAGSETDVPVISMDLFTTFAHVAGAKLPKGLVVDGKDALPVLEGKAKSLHDILFWQHGNQAAARRGTLKLLRQEGKADRLYDLAADPGEKNDLAAQRPQVVKQLGAALDKWLAGLRNRA